MTPTLSLSTLDVDSGNLRNDVKNKSKYLHYEINIQSEIDFSSKSITRTLMFSFHMHFSLIDFVLFHVPGSCVPRLRNVPCSGLTYGSENLPHAQL